MSAVTIEQRIEIYTKQLEKVKNDPKKRGKNSRDSKGNPIYYSWEETIKFWQYLLEEQLDIQSGIDERTAHKRFKEKFASLRPVMVDIDKTTSMYEVITKDSSVLITDLKDNRAGLIIPKIRHVSILPLTSSQVVMLRNQGQTVTSTTKIPDPNNNFYDYPPDVQRKRDVESVLFRWDIKKVESLEVLGATS